MTPDQVVEALTSHAFDEVRSVASPEFRADISSREIQRVWNEMEGSVGAVRSVEAGVIMHDLALRCEKGDAHLQVAYRDGTLSGLMLLEGPPTGRFGQ